MKNENSIINNYDNETQRPIAKHKAGMETLRGKKLEPTGDKKNATFLP